MKQIICFGIITFLCTSPRITHAEILITEIAWMGTSSSQYEEWLELYNDGDTEIPLSGWKIFKSGGTTLFALSGSIAAGEYYVVCRTTASLTNPLSGACNEQGAWGGSGLNNTSDQVVVKDAAGAIIDTADGAGGWPAGDSSSKQTMQKSGNEWITGIGTPGAPNSDADAGGGDDSAEDNGNEDDGEDTTTEVVDKKEKIELVEPDPVYRAHMIIPDYGISGVALPIKSEVKKDGVMITKRGRYEWSMGDGASYKFYRGTDIAHVFAYPGDYTVVLAYYSDVFRDEPDSIHRKKITIAPSSLEITGMTDDGGVILENNSGKDVDLVGWMIASNGQSFMFPKYTTIIKGGELAVSGKVLGFVAVKNSVVLQNPAGQVIARGYHPPAPSYIGGGTEQAEAATPESDWSQSQRASVAEIPESGFSDLFAKYGWYAGFGILAIIAVVAYLFIRLYASRDEIDESEELDYDLL